MQSARLWGGYNLVNSSVVFPVHAGFIQTPTSLNTTLGSVVEFKCVTTGLSVIFTVNGTPASEQEIYQEHNITFKTQPLSGQSIEGILSIPATKENNNTEIVCRVITSSDDEFSDPVELKVQGECLPICVKDNY